MSEKLLRLVRTDALQEGQMLSVATNAIEVLLCKVEGQIHALARTCTHGMAKLDNGTLKGHVLTCPLHQGRFDVRDGRCLQAPPVRPLPTYVVRIINDEIHIVEPPLAPKRVSFGPLN